MAEKDAPVKKLTDKSTKQEMLEAYQLLARQLEAPPLTFGQAGWPWAETRLTAGYVEDMRVVPGVGKYVMVFHGSGPNKQRGDANENANAHLSIAWSDDLKTWDWPGKPTAPARTSKSTISGKAGGC